MVTKEQFEELVRMLQSSHSELRKSDIEASRTVADAALYIKSFLKGNAPDLDTAERVLKAFVEDVAPKQVVLARLLATRSYEEMTSAPDPTLAPTEAMVAYTQAMVRGVGEELHRTAPTTGKDDSSGS